MGLYINTWKKTFTYTGRARRKEYILFPIINTLIMFCLALPIFILRAISKLYFTSTIYNTDLSQISQSGAYSFFSFLDGGFGALLMISIPFLVMFATILPSISLSVRRIHDIGYSGWWILLLWVLSFIPFLSTPCWLILLCKNSDVGENKYGECPKTDKEMANSINGWLIFGLSVLICISLVAFTTLGIRALGNRARASFDAVSAQMQMDGADTAFKPITGNNTILPTPPESLCAKAEEEAERAKATTVPEEKLFYLKRASRLCPTSAKYHVELGRIYESLDRKIDARSSYDKALEIDLNSIPNNEAIEPVEEL